MDEKRYLKFLEFFSILTIGENKVPNFSWKKQQTEKLSNDSFIKNLNYKGGTFRSDGSEISPTQGVGLVTGFEDLEVIDIDTKVFSTQIEKDEFWNEYLSTIRENILNFDDKIVIYQTKSGGYHLLYKSKRVCKNEKIAVLNGHVEAVIETRGIGGYIFAYPDKKVSKNGYFSIEYISDQDRQTIWNVSKAYDSRVELTKITPKTDVKIYQEGEITPWDDFNEKTDVWTIIQDDFTIIPRGNKENFILIKRNGSKNAQSGSIFKNKNAVYLFSTGTIYPHEKLITPFFAYACKYHNQDIKAAIKELYDQGFGSRRRQKKEVLNEIKPIEKIKDVEFPIEIFHPFIQKYIYESKDKLSLNVDYMGCSLIWLISVCVGNCFSVQVSVGHIEPSVVWMALIGKAGVGKTPSIYNVIFPLKNINSKEIKKYSYESEKYAKYMALDKKEKEQVPDEKKPKNGQFIANDITLEALIELHQESDNSVGIFKDEIAGWFRDMNKYRSGSDTENWLSSWSGGEIYLNRKTAKSSFVERASMPVLGGVQPSIFSSLYTEENKENGFMDRMLLSFPDVKAEKFNRKQMDEKIIEDYSNQIVCFYEIIQKLINRGPNGEIIPKICRFSKDAENEFERIYNKNVEKQNDMNENEYLKSMYPKQRSYIPRFALLINLFEYSFNNTPNALLISKESMLKAEKLSNYFVAQAKKMKIEISETKDMINSTKKVDKIGDKIKALFEENPDFNKTKAAELLGVSRVTIYDYLKKLNNGTEGVSN